MHSADRAGGDEGIEDEFCGIEEAGDVGDRLMGEIAADDAGIGDGVVGLADAREQQKLHVEDGIGRQDHEIGRLLPLVAVGIDKGDAGRALARCIEIDARHLAVVARREIRLAQQHRQDRGLRRCLGVIAAAEPFAEAAIGAGAEPHAERILVGARHVARRLRKRLVAEFARGLCEQVLDRTAGPAADWDKAASAAPRRDCRLRRSCP